MDYNVNREKALICACLYHIEICAQFVQWWLTYVGSGIYYGRWLSNVSLILHALGFMYAVVLNHCKGKSIVDAYNTSLLQQ